MLKVENLCKSYKIEDKVIKNISLEFESRGIVFLLGKSGSGKTTLLNLLGGIDCPTSGEIVLLGKEYSKMTEKQKDELRNIDISFVFQDFNLLPDLNVMENVMLPLQIQNVDNNIDTHLVAKKVIESVELSSYINRMPNELSGGQMQRVSIARAMIKSPKVLLADEPTGNLDSENASMVFGVLKKASESCLVIVVSHDEEAAYKYGDRVIKIVDGEIIADVKISSKEADVEYQLVKNDELIKSGISKKENAKKILVQEIEKSILEENDTDIRIKISQRKHNCIAGQEENLLNDNVVTARDFSGKAIFRYAGYNMKKHKKNIICAILMLMLTIMLIMLSALLSDYDVVEPIEEYINEYKLDRVNLSYIASYTNKLEEKKEKELSVGDFYEATIGSDLKDNKIGVLDDISVSYNDEFFIDSSIFALTNDFRICENIVLSEGEIVITEYIAKSLGIEEQPIGKELIIGKQVYSVVGCLDIGDYESRFNIYDDYMDNYEEYYMNNYCNVVFIREEDLFKDYVERKTIQLECSDLFKIKYESYFTNEVVIGKIETTYEDIELLYGKMPQAPNEILISEQYAFENGLITADSEYSKMLLAKQFEFLDVHSGYGNYFTDIINMQNYFEDGVRITGIYRDDEVETSYIILDDVYQEIIEDYCRKFMYNRTILYICPSDYGNVINYLINNNAIISEPSINAIYEFEHLVKQLKEAIIFLLFVLIIIAAFMVYHNISVSISNNKKVIGVLRSIGVSKKCTVKIFLVEAIMICLLSCVFATALNTIVISVVNKTVRDGVIINPYDILWWDIPLSVVIVVITFILFLFTAIIPIHKYAKKPPIQVIRN